MSQFGVQSDDHGTVFRQWQFKETVELEHQKQQIKEERRILEQDRKRFEQEKQIFYASKKAADQRAEHEKRLFDMKWRVLEGELRKLAAEKEQVERQRDFYRYVSQHEAQTMQTAKVVKGELFFCGVDSGEALRKRYKDLIKIYHPDNQNGDKDTIQEINMEYERLKALYG